jgi:ABC-type nitrate/sulfonate/bicarbonate transport system substrate-binding protein
MASARHVISAVLLALVIVGCGASAGDDRPEEAATLVLDFTPNAVHAGIYAALARGYDDAEGVHLTVRAPSASTDSPRLLLTGRARFAIMDIHDLALAREKGRDLVGIMAIVQRPLAAVLAQPSIRTPKDLEGRRAGVTGLPSDVAVLRTVVRGAGGEPRRVRTVTIGFNAVGALLARRVAAATAFWNAEGVALRQKRPGIREFRVDDYGAPPYPELVLVATRQTADLDPAVVRATVRALRRGYGVAIEDPPAGVQAVVDAARGTDRATVAREFDAVAPVLTDGRRFGTLDPSRLRAWGAWEAQVGIVRKPVDVDRAFAPKLANGS